MKYTRQEEYAISKLIDGLRKLDQTALESETRLKYKEVQSQIDIQNTKITFFKKGLLFRARQNQPQRTLT